MPIKCAYIINNQTVTFILIVQLIENLKSLIYVNSGKFIEAHEKHNSSLKFVMKFNKNDSQSELQNIFNCVLLYENSTYRLLSYKSKFNYLCIRKFGR